MYYGPHNACATQIEFSNRDWVTSAFATEALSLAYAVATSHPEDILHTDCQSIVTTIKKRRQFKNRPCAPLLAIIQSEAHRIRWQKGHPEGKGVSSLAWTPDQHGIYIADQVAANRRQNIHIPVRVVTSEDALAAMKRLPQFVVGDKFGPLIDDVATRFHTDKLRKYLTDRDACAVAQGRPAKWGTASARGASETCSLASLSISRAATVTRVLFDKLWHGGNQAKAFDMDTPDWYETRTCKCCKIATDSLAHLVLQCNHADMIAVRSQYLIQINALVAALRGVNNQAHKLLMAFRERFLGQGTPDIRPALGLWTQSLWNQFAAGRPQLTRCSKSRAALKKAYKELVEICLRMAVEMAATKRRIEKHGADPFRYHRRPRPPAVLSPATPWDSGG